MNQFTFKTFLLAALADLDEDGEATDRAKLAVDIHQGSNGILDLEGAALRDYLIRQDSERTDWFWSLWNKFTIWQKTVQRLPTEEAAPPLVVQELNEFCKKEIPEREALMTLTGSTTVVLTKQSINQIFAYRGTGKSFLAVALAGALAGGGEFLNLKATRECSVLYVDGELPDRQLQDRAKELVKAKPGFFRIVTIDSQPSHQLPSLATPSGRKAVEDALQTDSDVLILDSFSTLFWLSTNEEDELIDVVGWLNRLRSRGLCIIFLHHTGKNKMFQRGHSRTEDPLDVSIRLMADEEERDYLEFKLEYEKFRGPRFGVRSLLVRYRDKQWHWALLEIEKLKILAAYMKANPGVKSSRTIARDLQKAGQDIGSHTTVHKLIKELESRGGAYSLDDVKPMEP